MSDTLVAAFLAQTDAPCPGCGYNLRGLREAECPECSTPIELEVRGAQRDRRLPRWALAALAVYSAACLYTLADWAWTTLAPSRASGVALGARYWVRTAPELIFAAVFPLVATAAFVVYRRTFRRNPLRAEGRFTLLALRLWVASTVVYFAIGVVQVLL